MNHFHVKYRPSIKSEKQELRVDEDVLEAARRLQRCKFERFCSGSVTFHFTPEGKINTGKVEQHKKIFLTNGSS